MQNRIFLSIFLMFSINAYVIGQASMRTDAIINHEDYYGIEEGGGDLSVTLILILIFVAIIYTIYYFGIKDEN